MTQTVGIVNCGSEYGPLIRERVLETSGDHPVSVTFFPHDVSARELSGSDLSLLFVSGSPLNVIDDVVLLDPGLIDLEIPLTIGICYGHQALIDAAGGKGRRLSKPRVGTMPVENFGKGPFSINGRQVYQTHVDHGYCVTELPPGFQVTDVSSEGVLMGAFDPYRRIATRQDHPEYEFNPENRAFSGMHWLRQEQFLALIRKYLLS